MIRTLLLLSVTLLGSLVSAQNNKPSCLTVQNQTQFNPCVFNALGGLDDQVQACQYFVNTGTYQQCLCTKSKAVKECYDQFCPNDFSAPIFTKYFWDFCKGYRSNIALTALPTITGIPIVATFSPTPSPRPNVTSRSYFPSEGYSDLDFGSSGWIITFASLFLTALGLFAV
jgi:hypothetical protein